MFLLNENDEPKGFANSNGKVEGLVIDSQRNISFFSTKRLKSKEDFVNESRLTESNDSLDNLLDEMLDGTLTENKVITDKETLEESSMFFGETELLDEDLIVSALKFLMKPLHLSNDTAENQRQFRKIYSQIAATKNLDDDVFARNCTRILNFIIDALIKSAAIGFVSGVTSFIPILGQVATIWVWTKLQEDTAKRVLVQNKKVLEKAEKSFESKIKEERNPKNKKYLEDTLKEIKKSIEKIDNKLAAYEKAKNESSDDFDFEDNDEDLLDEEDLSLENLFSDI